MQFSSQARIKNDINLAPLIDVVFLLLAFYVLSSSFLKPGVLDINAPESESSAQAVQNQRSSMLELSSSGLIILDGKELSLNELFRELESLKVGAESDHRSLRLRADKEVKLQLFVSVLDIIKRAGISDVQIESEMIAKSSILANSPS